jgi:hypothetical protein|nr:MAG TPA: hypothetical protein [Bacteriophage sp.]
MYRLIAFNDVAKNFSAHFALSLSPYFDRQRSNETGKLHFIAHKFVRYLSKNYGYERTELLENFVCRKYSPEAWNFLKKLMK